MLKYPSINLSKHLKKQQGVFKVDKYKKAYYNIKRTIKDLLFENAALCDQVVLMQEKILIIKEERNFLVKKLQQYFSNSEPGQVLGFQSITSLDTSVIQKKTVAKKRAISDVDSNKSSSKIKKSPASKRKKLLHQIPLDSAGRPVFPISLGDFTVHSLGEIVSDRSDYYTDDLIFPVGYCSSRIYGSIKDPDKQCVYTCKVIDGGLSPRFEIVADNNLDAPIISKSIDQCHSLLLSMINQSLGSEVISTRGKGADFFGLSHPTVHHLIQSSPGVRKCHGYVWTKFEVNRSNSTLSTDENEATLNFNALFRSIAFNKSHLETIIKQEPEENYGENSMSTFRNLLLN
uniref:INO80 complex subunit E N-terminal domain-containing protein n=1 Tax=Clastoptera arizonana TaxID=38151 RepID=A0A1B6CYL5_9HEMI